MSEDAAPERIAVIWSPEARADLRAIDRETAMPILYCLDRYLASRVGDGKKLKPPRTDFRLFFLVPPRDAAPAGTYALASPPAGCR
ncbi:MAG: type II toxin-antitoxin system RelE family toxin [Acidobacteriota bacterium]